MRPNSGVWILRGVLIALSLTLSIVLIVHGNVAVGGLIAALAITRIMLFVTMHRRREQFRERRTMKRR